MAGGHPSGAGLQAPRCRAPKGGRRGGAAEGRERGFPPGACTVRERGRGGARHALGARAPERSGRKPARVPGGPCRWQEACGRGAQRSGRRNTVLARVVGRKAPRKRCPAGGNHIGTGPRAGRSVEPRVLQEDRGSRGLSPAGFYSKKSGKRLKDTRGVKGYV